MSNELKLVSLKKRKELNGNSIKMTQDFIIMKLMQFFSYFDFSITGMKSAAKKGSENTSFLLLV